MDATKWYKQLKDWGWAKEDAMRSVRHWFNLDDSKAAIKAVRWSGY